MSQGHFTSQEIPEFPLRAFPVAVSRDIIRKVDCIVLLVRHIANLLQQTHLSHVLDKGGHLVGELL